MLHRSMPIGAAITALKKEVADRQSALAILEALIATVASEVGSVTDGISRHRRRGKRGDGSGRVAIEIIRAAGRPLHGLREIVPALEAQGFKIKKSGLPTTLMRTGLIERVAPGTFGLKKGAGEPGAAAGTKELRAGA